MSKQSKGKQGTDRQFPPDKGRKTDRQFPPDKGGKGGYIPYNKTNRKSTKKSQKSNSGRTETMA